MATITVILFLLADPTMLFVVVERLPARDCAMARAAIADRLAAATGLPVGVKDARCRLGISYPFTFA
jgi:hypothetical protein